ncbi:MAG TPA: FkbM family methyltransferase [Bacteroidetes bacterium]|nr:FkbM family methyltransferase [Bacteroidota bacterium]
MNKQRLLKNLSQVEKTARASKLNRMLMQPVRYINAILFRELVYKSKQKPKAVLAKTFFGTKMQLLLPSSTDIYITGGKSHDSELRLAKFIINHLSEGDTFIDVGAHYGYYSLLASELVGKEGIVQSFEASLQNFEILKKNTAKLDNTIIHHQAVSDIKGIIAFYEFPNLFSEYNSLDITQFEHESWFKDNISNKTNVKSILLDEFLIAEKLFPKIIKIDVEGAEFKVVSGLRKYLQIYAPIVVMEFLSEERGNTQHKAAQHLFELLGYQSFRITKSGHLKAKNNIAHYLNANALESDNIVFVKT